ncbi:MAG: hypothetical protein ACLVJH_11050 [Faecalibacterium prausnitzii]
MLKNIASMAFPGAAQLLRDLFYPVVLALRGTGALLRHAHRVRKENGFGAALRASGHFLAHGIADNIRLVPRMAMYVLPVAALAVMVTVFQTTIRQPYALQVQVDEQDRGLCGQRRGVQLCTGGRAAAYQLFRRRAGALYRGAYLFRDRRP